jgi:hypothetical protein
MGQEVFSWQIQNRSSSTEILHRQHSKALSQFNVIGPDEDLMFCARFMSVYQRCSQYFVSKYQYQYHYHYSGPQYQYINSRQALVPVPVQLYEAS